MAVSAVGELLPVPGTRSFTRVAARSRRGSSGSISRDASTLQSPFPVHLFTLGEVYLSSPDRDKRKPPTSQSTSAAFGLSLRFLGRGLSGVRRFAGAEFFGFGEPLGP